MSKIVPDDNAVSTAPISTGRNIVVGRSARVDEKYKAMAGLTTTTHAATRKRGRKPAVRHQLEPLDERFLAVQKAVSNTRLNQKIEVELQLRIIVEEQKRAEKEHLKEVRQKMAELSKQMDAHKDAKNEIMRSKHDEAMKRMNGAEKTWWVEVYDSNEEKYYYFNHATQEVTWEKPFYYVQAADDEEMRAVIKIQCRYRARRDRRNMEVHKEHTQGEWERKMRRKWMTDEEKEIEYKKMIMEVMLDLKMGQFSEMEQQLKDGNVWVKVFDEFEAVGPTTIPGSTKLRAAHLEEQTHYYYNYLTKIRKKTKPTRYVDWTEDPFLLRPLIKMQTRFRYQRRLWRKARVVREEKLTKIQETMRKEEERMKKEQEAEDRKRLKGEMERPMEDMSAVWMEPDEEKALLYWEKQTFQAGEGSVMKTGTKEMSEMGVGLTLYFDFLRLLCWFFLAASFLVTPVIILNLSGEGIDEYGVDAAMLVYTTLGNQGVDLQAMEPAAAASYCTKNPTIWGCDYLLGGEEKNATIGSDVKISLFGALPTAVKSEILGLICMATDFLYSMLFMLVFAKFRESIKKAVADADEMIISASDYAIMVTGLPGSATERSIIQHFNSRYGCNADYDHFPLRCGCWGAPTKYQNIKAATDRYSWCKAPGAVTSMEHLGGIKHADDSYKGSWVAQVSLAHPLRRQISKYMAIRKYSKQLEEAKRLALKYTPGSRFSDYEKLEALGKVQPRLEKALRLVARLTTKISEFERGLELDDLKSTHENPMDICVAAFVVFNNEESYARCLDDYSTSSVWWMRWWQPQALRYLDIAKKKHAITVVPAPDPEDVLWENLEFTPFQRRMFKYFTQTVTLLCLLVSFVMIYGASVVKKDAAAALQDMRYCKRVIPATYYGSYEMLTELKKDWGDGDEDYFISPVYYPHRDQECPEGKYYITYPSPANETIKYPIPNIDYFAAEIAALSEDEGRMKKFLKSRNLTRQELFSWDNTLNGGKGGFHLNASQGLSPVMRNNTHFSEQNHRDVRLCTDPCIDMGAGSRADDVCLPIDCVVPSLQGSSCRSEGLEGGTPLEFEHTFMRRAVGFCYCNQLMTEKVAELGFLTGISYIQSEVPMCAEFVTLNLKDGIFGIAVSVVILLVNTLIKEVMWSLTEVERHISHSAFLASVSIKIFLAQFVNTALILLLVYASVPLKECNGSPHKYSMSDDECMGANNITHLGSWGGITIPGSEVGFFTGEYDGFSREWYSSVGAAVALTMVINVLAPHMTPISDVLLQLWTRDFFVWQQAVTSQRHLQELYTGAEMRMYERFPAVLNTLFVTFFYCSGLPILLPMAGLMMWSTYVLDKYLILKFYKKPFINQALAEAAASLLPYALFMHLGVAIWFYGNDDVVKSMSISGLTNIANANSAANDEAQEAANIQYEEIKDTLIGLDPFGAEGFAVKLVKVNCFPLFLLLIFAVVKHLVQKFRLDSACFGCLKTVDKMIACAETKPSIPMRLLETLEEHPICAFTANYEQRLPDGNVRRLGDLEKADGWKIIFNKHGDPTKVRPATPLVQ
jgi:hypothetical protein